MKTTTINAATTKFTPARREFDAIHVCDECSDAAIGAMGECEQEPSDGRACENCISLANEGDAAA